MSNEFVAQKGIVSKGGITYPYSGVSSNYQINENDYLIDCTTGSFNVTLPSSTNLLGKIFVVKNSGSGSITINTTNSQTIDDSLTKIISQYDSITVQSDGFNWIILNSASSGTSGSGTSGTSGENGTSGTSGNSGTSGSSGVSVSGTSGTSGGNGTSGTSGVSVSGTSGTSGNNGTSGSSGVSVSGTSGTSGGNGTSGTSGNSGTSGSSGVSVSGTSGTSGNNGTSGSSGTGFSTITNPRNGGVLISNSTINSASTATGFTVSSGQLLLTGTNSNSVFDIYYSGGGNSYLISRFKHGSFPQVFINKDSNPLNNFHLDVNGAINTSDGGLSINDNKINLEYNSTTNNGFFRVNNGSLNISASTDISITTGLTSSVRIGTNTGTSKVTIRGSSGENYRILRVEDSFSVPILGVFGNRRVGIGGGINSPDATLTLVSSGTTYSSNAISLINGLTQPLFHVKDSGDIGIGTSLPTSKVQIYGTSTSLLNVSGSTGNLVEVINSNTGNLLEVGTLVNRPIFAVNTDGNLYFNVTGIQIGSGGGPRPLYQIPASSGNSVIFDYYLFNNSLPDTNFRMGNVSAYWANTSSVAGYRDNVYFSSGNTSDITLTVDISNNLVTLFAISTINTWGIKATARVL